MTNWLLSTVLLITFPIYHKTTFIGQVFFTLEWTFVCRGCTIQFIDPFQAWRHITWHCELEDKLQFVYNMAAKATTKRGLLPGYFESLQQKESKERYLEKLKSIEGQDPYEIPRKEWIDDVDCWPDVTYINVGMYLFFYPWWMLVSW